MTDLYAENMKKGLEYQDFIVHRLMREGLFIGIYASRKYQFEYGESASGIEIKFDGKLHETGNLYFETAEKANVNNLEYVSSGIMRQDNTWAYLIGDYHEAFLFSKKQLCNLLTLPQARQRNLGMREREIATSRGFTLPKEKAMEWLCLKHFVFDNAA